MITLDRPLREGHFERPTSRGVLYDVQDSSSRYTRGAPHENYRVPLADTRRRLKTMLRWKENWDGEGSAKPKQHAILKASRWIRRMRVDATRTGNRWVEPHVVPDENGDIAFEWWNDGRNLIVYVSPEAVYCLQVWGPDMESEMVDFEIEDSADNQKIWRWLME